MAGRKKARLRKKEMVQLPEITETVQLTEITESLEAVHFNIKESTVKPDKVTDLCARSKECSSESSDVCYKQKADYLNARIKKKKKAKLRRKERNKVTKITEDLKAIHFVANESIRKSNTQKTFEALVEELVLNAVVNNKSESLKKVTKKRNGMNKEM